MCYVYNMEYSSAAEREKATDTFKTLDYSPEKYWVKKKSQSQKVIYYVIPYIKKSENYKIKRISSCQWLKRVGV